MRISQLFFLLGILFLGTHTANAQEKMEARNGFEKGFRAVQFGITNNFTLSSFADGNFSFIRYQSESKARFIRGSINSTLGSSSQENTDKTERPQSSPNTTENTEKRDNSGIGTNLRVHLGSLSYMETQSDVLPFISRSVFLGMNISKNSDDRDRMLINSDDLSDEDRFDANGFSITPVVGINGGFGVEYFVAKNISLHAQTGLELSYSYGISNYDSETRSIDNNVLTEVRMFDRSQNSHQLRLQTTGVLFGLSAFF